VLIPFDLRFKYFNSGSSASSSSIFSMAFLRRWSFFNAGSPSYPLSYEILFLAKYSSSSFGIFLKTARFLNLLSTLFKTLRLPCPVQPSLTFSSLLNETSKYCSFGSLNAGNSENLLLEISKYLSYWRLSSPVNRLTFLILFPLRSRCYIFSNSFRAVGSGILLPLRLTL